MGVICSYLAVSLVSRGGSVSKAESDYRIALHAHAAAGKDAESGSSDVGLAKGDGGDGVCHCGLIDRVLRLALPASRCGWGRDASRGNVMSGELILAIAYGAVLVGSGAVDLAPCAERLW